MAKEPGFWFLILGVNLVILCVDAKRDEHADQIKPKHHIKRSKSKTGEHYTSKAKGNPWPFLPSAGSHQTTQPGFPSYPFMIVAPPNPQTNDETQGKDAKGSKYFTSSRGSVAYPAQLPLTTGYVPFYFIVPPYSTEQHRRQIVPRHHWAFSQWPFDSHEYAFAPHSPDTPHLPRWGPSMWNGAGPDKHWGINREGLPSPFGIGLAPHMGGQGYVGLEGEWPSGHGYPLPKNFPISPLQHNIP